ncbi:MAG: hypothetical protein O7A98_10505 [Acidobacteria bacterium]|nr:hypothetical protein [Acidobacteriota bacterium]
MTRQDHDSSDQLREALRNLPRELASADFTQRLLVRRATEISTPKRASWPRLAAAATLTLVVVGGFYLRHESQALEARRHREALQQRRLELELELAELRQRVAETPTLYLGTTEDFDLVLDLAPWMDQPSVQPAAYNAARQ